MGKSAPKAPSNTTTTQKTEPYLKGEVQQAANRAGELYQAGQPAYFPGQTYTNFSPETEQALAAITGRATSGSPLTGAANTQALSTINGDYLNSNPYIDQIVGQAQGDITDNFLQKVLPGLTSNFAGSGRYGSGLQRNITLDATGEAAQAAANAGSQIRYQNYDAERARQLGAVAAAPQLAQADYNDANALLGVGSARESLAQAKLQDQIDRYNYDAYGQQNALDDYIQRIGALNSGNGSVTGTQRAASTGGGSALGALAGGLGGALGLGPTIGGLVYGNGIAASSPALASLGGPAGLLLGGGLGLLGGLLG